MSAKRSKVWGLLLAAGMACLAGLAAMAVTVERIGIMPRVLAPYVEKRSSGHNRAIIAVGAFASRTLLALDRGGAARVPSTGPLALTLGAQNRPVGSGGQGPVVSTIDELREAMARAEPGQVITLMPGTYRVRERGLDASRPGRADAPITVRAAQPESAKLDFEIVEGFRISAPYWHFENLSIRGVCADDSSCEHAFHVYGAASHFVARNNTIADFNAHFKINAVGNEAPDDGLIEANTLLDTHVRNTPNPVTPIDLVVASGWIMRGNVIRDFIKGDGDRVSYGAFVKGGGRDNRFERNLVWCERDLTGQPGQRVGLSLGGGGTGKEFCRDHKCVTEQEQSIIAGNLILACSDVGIYLNKAAASRIDDNTLLDTAGIDVRFPASSATLNGNLVDGPIRNRDGGLLHLGDNRSASVWQSFAGLHPVRALFTDVDPSNGLRWRATPPRRATSGLPVDDLCSAQPRAQPAYGAFDSFDACLR